MNKQVRITILLSITITFFLAQPIAISAALTTAVIEPWAKSYGGSGQDVGQSIIAAHGGGFVVVATTRSFGVGYQDIWVLKLDDSGAVIWQKTYGGPGHEGANEIHATADGGYMVAGFTGSFGFGTSDGNHDIWLLKLDGGGNVVWQKTYGGPNDDGAYSAHPTADGGYIVSGWTRSFAVGTIDFWVLKLNSDGTIEWQKSYGGHDDDGGLDARPTGDGGYIVAGYTYSFERGGWILKLDANGQLLWQRAFPGRGPSAIIPSTDGGFVAAGIRQVAPGDNEVWLLKLDESGKRLWEKTYGTQGPSEHATSVLQTADGGYLVTGVTGSFSPTSDVWLLKLDPYGDIEWQNTYGGTDHEGGSSVVVAGEDTIAIAGNTIAGADSYDVWVLTLGSLGQTSTRCQFMATSSVPAVAFAGTMLSTSVSAVTSSAVPGTSNATVRTTSVIGNADCPSGTNNLRITTASPLPVGMIGLPYATTLQAAGGTPPYTWSIAAGALPPGLSLNATTGEISGTPTTAGTYGFTVQVTDSSGGTATGPFAVAPPPPSGTAGSSYSVPVTVVETPPDSGTGTPACTNYEVVGGSLPDGMSLDPTTGVISGTPTDGGTYTFTVQCVVSSGDTTGQTATKDFTITISNPLPTLSSLDPGSAVAGAGAFNLTLYGTNFVGSSVVHWNGAPRVTTYVSSGEVRAQILATDIASQGTGHLTVVNPEPNGGASNALPFNILPPNLPPSVNANGPYYVGEGSTVVVAATGSDPEGHALSYAWDLDNDGAFETAGQSVLFSAAALDGAAVHTVAVRVTDVGGLTAMEQTTVAVENVAPTATFAASSPVNEGELIHLSLTDAFDPSAADSTAGFSYSFNCGNGFTPSAGEHSTTCPTPDDGTRTVKGIIRDKDGGEPEYTAIVLVGNLPPVVGPITAPVEPVQVNSAINVSASFTDPGVLDTHMALWDWGDGTTSTGTVTEADGAGLVTGSHAYLQAGVYTLKLIVTDDDGGAGASVFEYVVVFDPDGGFVTGGGWINSPAGAYAADPALIGKANFGFVSRYQNGATVPTGETEFQFRVAALNFHSTGYEWLVVAGAKAQYKGSGTINGGGDYGFLLTATDGQVSGGGGVDKFRIKIWDRVTGNVVYDNQMGAAEDAHATTVLAGGSIVIHK